MLLHRPGIQADAVVEARTAQHVLAAERVGAAHAARLAHADLRGDLGDLGGFEARHLGAQEAQVLDDLAPPFDLGRGQLAARRWRRPPRPGRCAAG
jgi:hypothetical protein